MSSPDVAENPNFSFGHEFEIRKCVYWIMFNKYQRFPDHLLKYSTDIALTIEQEVGVKLYILGDTTFGSCCVDYVAAKHITADSVIHFGRACLTSHEDLPTLYVFPKFELDVDTAGDTIIEFSEACEGIIVLLYDVGFGHFLEDFLDELAIVRNRVRISRLATPQQNVDAVRYSSSDTVIEKFGRIFSVPSNVHQKDVTFLYIMKWGYEKNLENFVLAYPNTKFYRYDSQSPGGLTQTLIPEIFKKKLFLVQKIKEAKRVGILVSTLATDRFMEAIERIKTLCKLKMKKSYIISVGKINPAKLANFSEIDVFVMVSCPETDIPNDKDYYQPIASMMEVEMALNDHDISWQKTVKDFREFLYGGQVYKEINENSLQVVPEADVSLLSSSNKLLSNTLVDCDMAETSDSTLATRDPMVVGQNVTEGLTSRSWQGLKLNIGDTPVEKASTGQTGTPSSGYQRPSSSKRS